MNDVYRSIARPTSAETKVEGSRFIAEAFPVHSEEDAARRIESVRKREHGATHHCTAYRVGDVFRFDDDGEPSGTAGRPILRQIDAFELTNTLVVVTRYFGGTKLGTGGLARAYGEAARAVLDQSKFVDEVISDRVRVSFGYDDTSPAMHTINRFGAEVLGATYSERTELVIAVRRSRADAFIEAFVDALGGRADVERLEDDRSA